MNPLDYEPKRWWITSLGESLLVENLIQMLQAYGRVTLRQKGILVEDHTGPFGHYEVLWSQSEREMCRLPAPITLVADRILDRLAQEMRAGLGVEAKASKLTARTIGGLPQSHCAVHKKSPCWFLPACPVIVRRAMRLPS